MATLRIEAHAIDDDFEKSIKNDFDVVIIDRVEEPWCVTFKGERANLVKMVAVHWDAERAESLGAALQD